MTRQSACCALPAATTRPSRYCAITPKPTWHRCFHAQQAVEKALKAVLTIKQSDFRRTHDLEEPANLLGDTGVAVPFAPRDFRRLNPFAVEFRYDDEGIALTTREEADCMVKRTLRWAAEIVSEVASHR
ncbi:MAG: HEPN domain-containing protein [Gammaproteobacteria bacterium]